ncbi:AfsR/SARP family transcriptional regulator [Clostridiisalibacter paucivorans]|uniref:AfsR/SARP family transcriptional regulator n=1 Tax=Clostridiisalibacter paucivorans TaxID=408753 RepID=UPI00047B91D7|nr:BTAD domain-containing putative transcriptional regulator [Clostridiisalibacter paucivorans]
MAKLEIYMLGNLKILLDGSSIIENMSAKAMGILCYLVLNKGKDFNRDRISSMFWNFSNEDAARYNLRYNLWSLRKILKDKKKNSNILYADKDICRINDNSNIYVDIYRLENFNIQDYSNNNNNIFKLEELYELYRGEFLEGFYIKGCPEFNDWIFYKREKYQRKYFEISHLLVEQYVHKGMYYKSIDLLEEMLKINPLQEELYEKLIKIYLAKEDRSAALKHYKRCCTILREELNIGPGVKIKELYKEIKNKDTVDTMKENKGHSDNERKENIKILGHKKNIIKIPCYPVGVNYYWISNLIDHIIESYDMNLLKNISENIWIDLLRVNGKVRNIVQDLNTCNLTVMSEKNRIFLALENLLNIISKDNHINIQIDNLSWIDNVSYKFIKYYTWRNRNSNVDFIVINGNDISRHEQLKELDIKFL